jgi:hypothetical protein
MPRFLRISTIVAVATAMSCIQDLHEFQPYADVSATCTVGADPSDAAALCLQERSGNSKACAGSISFAGQLQGAPVAVVDQPLFTGDFRECHPPSGPDLITEASLTGTAATFFYTLRVRGLGGVNDGSVTLLNPQTYVPAIEGDDSVMSVLTNGQVSVLLRIQNGKESASVVAETAQGYFRFVHMDTARIRGEFDLFFREPGDHLSGCIDALATNVILTGTCTP